MRITLHFIATTCIFLFFSPVLAHPPVGIVCDSRGNIYYSDLQHVWKVSTDGKKIIAVRNVHTHELYMDDYDNVYGEGSIYSGEKTNKFYHYLWRLNKSMTLDTLKSVTEGFFIENYSHARNKNGDMFWIKHFAGRTEFMKTTRFGMTAIIAAGDFKRVQWMHAIGDNVFYVQHGNIHRIDNFGSITKIASTSDRKAGQQDALFGIWSDGSGRLHVANFTKRIIQRVEKDGRLKTVYTSPAGWHPTSGVFDRQGRLWVLETNARNEIRVTQTNSKE